MPKGHCTCEMNNDPYCEIHGIRNRGIRPPDNGAYHAAATIVFIVIILILVGLVVRLFQSVFAW